MEEGEVQHLLQEMTVGRELRAVCSCGKWEWQSWSRVEVSIEWQKHLAVMRGV